MNDCHSILSINTRQGTTQLARSLQALQADYIKLDERTITDFIYYAQRLSQHLNFYNRQHLVDGDWTPFFKTESVAILVYLSKWDIGFATRLEQLQKEIALSTDEAERQTLAWTFYKALAADILTMSDSLAQLSDEVAAKEYYIGSTNLLNDLLNSLQLQISGSTDIRKTIQDFVFAKTGQSIEAILWQWKNRSLQEIDYLLNNYSSYKPHYALFLSFLKLLQYSLDDLNRFTQRHLDFYYQQVLRLSVQKAIPDAVHLIVEPSTDQPFELPAQTIFPAKKNTAGLNKYYASSANQSFNNIQVKQVLSAVIKNGHWYRNDLTALNAAGPAYTFFQTSEEIRPALYLTHPILYMRGGERRISIRFNGSVINHLHYDFYITDEKEFKPIDPDFISSERITLPASEKAIVAFDAKIHPNLNLNTDMPVLKMVLKYGLQEFKFQKLSINVHVLSTTHFLVSNDTGLVDISKPFKPFGEFPTNDHSVVMTCNEFFIKKGATLKWRMPAHYKNYCVFEYLKNGVWTEVGPVTNNPFKDSDYFVYRNETPCEEIQKDALLQSSSRDGYIRLRLSHNSYKNQAFLNRFIQGAKKETVDMPQAPTVQKTSIDYIDEAVLYEKTYQQIPGHKQNYCFVETAFGYKQYTIPVMPKDGEILIGFDKVEADRSLSLLFQLQEGSANPLKEAAEVKWQYLSDNTWHEFKQTDLNDDTLGLQQSGLVQFTIPSFSNQLTTMLDSSLFWIRISVNDLTGICHAFGIHSQALKAVLIDYESIGTFYTEPTPPQTIKESYHTGTNIKKIKQPYVSFGGVAVEDEFRFNRRVSERLRHKQRAITGWDYERLVLEQFPEVYKVKTLNHYQYDTQNVSAVAAGYTTLIVIAQSSVTENPVEWKPLPSLGLRKRIVEYLQPFMSAHVRFQVKPPVLEDVMVQCKVAYKLNPGDDSKFLAEKLKEALNQFISPWAYNHNSVDFVGAIAYSKFIQLMDNLSFVDFVTELQLFHDGVAVDEIVPKTDYSLFKPNQQHLLIEIKEPCS